MEHTRVNAEIQALVERWCERKDLRALAGVLPAWLHNNGLTDGWADLAADLRTMSASHELPADEREQLKRLFVEIDFAIRNR